MSANLALHTMYAHRLWINLWMSLGHPEENHTHPGGNALVTVRLTRAAHSAPSRCTRAAHSHCARPRRGLAGPICVFPGIHHPYDDYQFCNGRQTQTQVGKRQTGLDVACGLIPPVKTTEHPTQDHRSSEPSSTNSRPDKEGDR